MSPSNVELAILNNTRWYQAMFDAHGLASQVDGRVWRSHENPPPFHSNLVVLSPHIAQAEVEGHISEIAHLLDPAGWSLKDSYANLDLAALGFEERFQAEWIWRDGIATASDGGASGLTWARVTSEAGLLEWEAAWWGDAQNEAAERQLRQFPDQLLASPDHVFLAGRLGGRVVAGGIANRSPGVVGLSNVFSPQALAGETWPALVDGIAAQFPDVPLVGYERGADLQRAQRAGFVPIGPLRVWHRPAPEIDCPS